MRGYLTDIRKRKDLLMYLVASGLKAEHRNSFLGYFWWLLDPLLGTAIYYFVVVFVFRRGEDSYGLFLVIGMVVWRWFSATLGSAATSVLSQRGIITQVYVPKVIFPLGVALTQVVHFGFGLAVVLLFVLLFRIPPSLHWVWVVYIAMAQFLFQTALALVLGYAAVFVRDIENLLRHVLQLWFFGSPILWGRELISVGHEWLLTLNPIAHLVGAYREVLLSGGTPDTVPLLIIGAGSLVLAIMVVYFYSRHEHRLVKAL